MSETTNGFVFLLATLQDPSIKTLYDGDTKGSIVSALRTMNSSSVDKHLHQLQPWSIVFSIWKFHRDVERSNVKKLLLRLLSANTNTDNDMLTAVFKRTTYDNAPKVLLCGECGKVFRQLKIAL